MTYEYIASGNSTASVPLGEYSAQILRGWPDGGARERTELVQQGASLVNGDVVAVQSDGTVNKVTTGSNRNVGLVIRGNGDSASSANANGVFMQPQPAKAIASATWSGGVLSLTITAGHNYVVGNTVTIAGNSSDTNSVALNGSYIITGITSATVFTVALAANPGTITIGTSTSQLTSTANNSGKAVVLWGNYIVATSNYAAGSWAPGTFVTGTSGQFAVGSGGTTPATTDIGFCLRVQGASGTTPGYVVIAAY